MFNLPKSTEIKPNKIIYKKTLYETFPEKFTGKRKASFDREISRLTLTHELSDQSISSPKTEDVPAIYLARLDLKTKNYREDNLTLLAQALGQKLLFVLVYQGEYKLALYEGKLLAGDWQREEDLKIDLRGLNLKTLWENLVRQVGGLDREEGKSLGDQISRQEERERLEKTIQKLEKRALKEGQAKKKLDLFQELKKYKKELEEL